MHAILVLYRKFGPLYMWLLRRVKFLVPALRERGSRYGKGGSHSFSSKNEKIMRTFVVIDCSR